MNRLFGKPKAADAPSLSESIQASESRADTLTKKISALDTELRRYREQIGLMKPGPAQNAVKQKALRVMRQKKMYEGQRDQLMQTTMNMEQTHFATQSMKDSLVTVGAMRQGVKEMKRAAQSVRLDDIEDMQDELEDMLDMSNEIQESLSRSYGVADDIDEADLDAELEALGDDLALDDDVSYLDTADSLPTAPTTVPLDSATKPMTQVKLDEFGLPVAP